MLSVYDLAFFKEMYRGCKIVYALFGDKEFVFKSLGRKEYQNIIELTSNEHELEDAICQTALVYPDDYDFAYSPMAGISTSIAPTIIEVSGFTSLDSVIEMYEDSKRKASIFDQQCMALIKMAFPEYNFEEMEEWTWEKLMDITAKAEFIVQLQGHNIQMVNRKDEVEEEAANEQDEVNQDDFVKELRANGIDPMLYFQNDILKKKEYLDFPLIGGIHWQNEGVLSEIKRQMGT